MFWRVGIARNAVFFHSFVASKARKGRSEKRKLRRIGCPRCRQNLHHACARERFGSQNRSKLAGPEHFWKLISTKFAPRLRASAIWKSKSLKTDGLGTFFEVQSVFRVAGAGISTRSKFVAGAGVREGCKNVGRRGGFEEGLKRGVSRGRRSDFALCDVDVWSLRRWNRGRVANFMSRKCYFAVIISRGSYRTSYASAQLFRGRRSTFEACTWKSLKRIGILRSSIWSTCHFWRKSRRNASFLIVKVPFLKEVSHKSFVFELQSFIFEGSLAEMLRFWTSKLQFWRKSRRKASFLSFKVSILKEVSQKCFAFDLQSFVFEASLAQKLRFWASKLHFWRKSRRNASFLSFKAFFFGGSLAEKLRLTKSLNHTSIDNQIIWTSNHLTSKSLESQTNWQPTHLNLKSIDIQITWISNQLTTNSFESQIDWHPNHLNLRWIDNRITWISNQLTTTSLESQINRQPKSFEARIDWQSSNQQTTQIIWNTRRLTTKSFESQITWQSKSLESHFTWIWHQPTFEPLELHTPSSYRFLISGNFRHRLVR